MKRLSLSAFAVCSAPLPSLSPHPCDALHTQVVYALGLRVLGLVTFSRCCDKILSRSAGLLAVLRKPASRAHTPSPPLVYRSFRHLACDCKPGPCTHLLARREPEVAGLVSFQEVLSTAKVPSVFAGAGAFFRASEAAASPQRSPFNLDLA